MQISVVAETLFHLGSLPVTNSLLTSWIVTLILIISGVLVGLNYRQLPSGLQQFFELVYSTFEDMAVSIVGEDGKKYVPLIVTFFLLIIFSNWFGIIPGVGSVGRYVTENGQRVFIPFLRGANADLNSTIALAVISVGITQYYGIVSSGLRHHLHHFTNPFEIISEASKLLSFSFRLFGNVFAGEVLLLAFASILVIVTHNQSPWLGIPGGIIQTPFFVFEIFVGFIQAFIFSVLTLVFISIYSKETSR